MENQMVLTKEQYDLLSWMKNAKGVYITDDTTPTSILRTVMWADRNKFIALEKLEDTKEVYRLTELGFEAVLMHELKEATGELVSDEGDEVSLYPMLFVNINNGSVVLAINNTSGTIVEEAQNVAEGEYALPLGTFQTCFIPFYIDKEWQPINEVVIKV